MEVLVLEKVLALDMVPHVPWGGVCSVLSPGLVSPVSSFSFSPPLLLFLSVYLLNKHELLDLSYSAFYYLVCISLTTSLW